MASAERSSMAGHPTNEHSRLADDARRDWLRWGPYVAERAWGTVREDYSRNGEVWSSFTHDQARSRAYRWNEDGLAGLSDIDQRLCFALAFWNGRDPFLKERLFGLTGDEGNHGEDAKEMWWHADATPSASYLEWQYAYPQTEFPYDAMRTENARRSRLEREFEIDDTDVFDDGYWDITVTYAKADENTIVASIDVTNRDDKAATLHVLPTLWFRNTWHHDPDRGQPSMGLIDGAIAADDGQGTRARLTPCSSPGSESDSDSGSDGGSASDPVALFCDNETNDEKIWGSPARTAYPKDGINDHVVDGRPTVNPAHTGTTAAFWFTRTVDPGATATVQLVLDVDPAMPDTRTGESASIAPLTSDAATSIVAERRADADAFYDAVIPDHVGEEDRRIARQALGAMVWGKQFYAFDVEAWLSGDPGLPPPPPGRESIRNGDWRHHFSADVISMPDPWEYPWYAAWDLAFHCIPLAHIDPRFAKDQLLLLCDDRFMHPNGQLPAYEWSFGDVNPPVHAMAALLVYEIDGSWDRDFLARIFNKLVLNFAWWVNRKDVDGNNVFQGGFLGLDNIGPVDRSEGLPAGYHLDQADGTAWMASYALHMLELANELGSTDPVYQDMATKFFDHFAYIATAMHERGLWDDGSGFYYDVLHGHGERRPLTVRSMVGLLPICATGSIPTEQILDPSEFADHVLWFVSNRRRFAENIMGARLNAEEPSLLLAVADLERLERVLDVMLDPDEFLSPFGIRSLSAAHRDQRFHVSIGSMTSSVGYEPGESQTPLFGGNSNWRGPVWFPVNHLLVGALRRYAAYAGDSFEVEYPTGSGHTTDLAHIADDLTDRLIAIFRSNERGARPFTGDDGERWDGRIQFHEYFDGDDGRGLGASHQTGWTGLVADLIIRRERFED